MSINTADLKYLRLIDTILETGIEKNGTISITGYSERYDISAGKIPVIGVKRTFWRGIVAELLWFISGSTDIEDLHKQNIHFWDTNLEASKITNAQGEKILGDIYGKQWRRFGPREIDQLKNAIEMLKTAPYSRRILVNAYNPEDLDKMCLPPCHYSFQFIVNGDKLSIVVNQRSADVGLGLPFNIASYSLLTHIIANICGYKTGELIHFVGDAHIYNEHIEKLKELKNKYINAPVSKDTPIVKFNNLPEDIDLVAQEHITLENYKPLEKVELDLIWDTNIKR